jgi:hypothetical protein
LEALEPSEGGEADGCGALTKITTENEGSDSGEVDFKVGRIGELLVEQQLIEKGWHPVRLDTAQFATNADLLAVNREKRVSIQVKTTNAYRTHAHSYCIGFGYATGHLLNGHSIFNSKISPLISDLVVGVHYNKLESRFVVLPVGFAENLCRTHAQYWYNVPLKRGGKRTTNFPIYICLTKTPSTHVEHHARLMNAMLKFENAWHLLSEKPEKLRDTSCWPIK